MPNESRVTAFFRPLTERLRARLHTPVAVRMLRRTVLLTGVMLACGAAAWTVFYAIAIYRLPDHVGDTLIYSADGRPWFRYDESRRYARLADISPYVQQAVVAIEDRRFYNHFGIDPVAITRALGHNIAQRRMVQGGSTLTQQLARILFLSNGRTFRRKLQEAVLALLLEARFSKDQILEGYLNRVYLGTGIHGVEEMAQTLLGKPARALTLDEAALVVGLIRAPSTLSPWSNPDGALRQRNRVLERLREQDLITPDAYAISVRRSLNIGHHPLADRLHGGYAKDFVRTQVRELGQNGHKPESKVFTTFIPELQDAAEAAVANGLRRIDSSNLQAALVAIDPRTGDVLALVGGRNFLEAPFNRAFRSRRPPASAFKPFVFAAALERGFSPISVMSNLASFVPEGNDGWVPQNSGGYIYDQANLRDALVASNNRATVALQQQIGTASVVALAANVGFGTLPKVPSLALGTGTVSPLELTAAFAMFPNGGLSVKPRVIERVLDSAGNVVVENRPQRKRALSEQTAFQLVTMLQDTVNRGTAAPARTLGVNFPVGGKTGTTDEFKDAWFVGFSSAVVVGVWVGFDRPATIDVDAYGSRIALPIWAEFMLRAASLLPPQPFAKPAGIREVRLCRDSYLRPVKDCPIYTEYFKETDAIPETSCPWHGQADADSRMGKNPVEAETR